MVLFNKILKEVEGNGSSSVHSNLNALTSKIKTGLKKKKLLLVLDDVWDYKWWKEVKGLRQNFESGSKVLITTREIEVAKSMGFAHLHELKCLDEEQSWQLLVSKALKEGETEEDLDEFEDVGRGIAKKCGGLPLALNVVGNLLRRQERTKPTWESLLHNPVWKLKCPQENNQVFAAIALSYVSLEFQFKRCLTYCGMYPKDFKMKRMDLVRLWVAEGFISKVDVVEMEVTAERCLDTLVACSLIQNTGNGHYTLHDIVHDFAVFVTEEHVSTNQLKNGKVADSIRYLSSVDGDCSSKALRRKKKLRGLMCHGVQCLSAFNFAALPHLRVLDLSGGNFLELPEAIGDLTLLKYINLSRSKICELPESITKLHELQTLDLSHSSIKKLPDKISALASLRHLDNEGTTLLEHLPSEIGKLTCLQTLPKFVVGTSQVGSSLMELSKLNNLSGTLSIDNLERVETKEIGCAQLERKENLRKLELSCDEKCMIELDETVIKRVEEVYEQMKPPRFIEIISISSYPGRKCPTWMCSTTYSSLQEISIFNCKFLENLPNLGAMPNLVDLRINFVNNVKIFDSTFKNFRGKVTFPKLRKLTLNHMKGLEEWKFDPEIENMPCLMDLDIVVCPRLRDVPFLPSLKKVRVHGASEWEGWLNAEERDMLCLEDLQVSSCEKLKLLPSCPKLEHLVIYSCDELVNMPHSLVLVRATVKNCPLVTCPWKDISELKELRHLEIVGSPNLESLIHGLRDGKLETLVIEDCSTLTSIPALTGLKSLSLTKLPELKSLSVTLLGNMKRLERLALGHPLGSVKVDELLASLEIKRFRSMRVSGFHDLEAEWLSSRICGMIHLEELVIEGFPRLLSIINVLEQHPLPMLQHLQLASSMNSCLTCYSSRNLTCILVIDSVNMSNELKGLVHLSSNIRSLVVRVLGELESLPEWIQHLQQVEYLKVYGSPHLNDIPDWLNQLRQLEWLELDSLPELEKLSETAIKGLHSLERLEIKSCPKLSSLPDAISSLPRFGSLVIHGSSPLVNNIPNIRNVYHIQ